MKNYRRSSTSWIVLFLLLMVGIGFFRPKQRLAQVLIMGL